MLQLIFVSGLLFFNRKRLSGSFRSSLNRLILKIRLWLTIYRRRGHVLISSLVLRKIYLVLNGWNIIDGKDGFVNIAPILFNLCGSVVNNLWWLRKIICSNFFGCISFSLILIVLILVVLVINLMIWVLLMNIRVASDTIFVCVESRFFRSVV